MRVNLKHGLRNVVWLAVVAAAYIAAFRMGASAEERRLRPVMTVLQKRIALRERLIQHNRQRLADVEAAIRRNESVRSTALGAPGDSAN